MRKLYKNEVRKLKELFYIFLGEDTEQEKQEAAARERSKRALYQRAAAEGELRKEWNSLIYHGRA